MRNRSSHRFCSKICASRSHPDVWNSEQDGRLIKLISKVPVRVIIRDWNIYAVKKKWNQRTAVALQNRITILCKKQHLTSVCTKDEFSQATLARLLDIRFDRVRSWIRQGLKAKTVNNNIKKKQNRTAISRLDLEDFANKHPELFDGINPSYLRKIISKNVIDKIIVVAGKLSRKRDYTIVRLDDSAVYTSCEEAAQDVGMVRQSIRYNLEHGGTMKNGMEWARLDYPLFIVPSIIRDEFNYHAGWILIEIYQDLKRIEGFSKRSVLPTANRIAVQITLFAFKRNYKEQKKGRQLTPKADICSFWKEKILARIQHFYNQPETNCFHWILTAIKSKVAHIIKNKIELEEFALDVINENSKYFMNKSFLPKGYQPKTSLEKADYYTAIFSSSVMATVDVSLEKSIPLIVLKALNHIKNQQIIKQTYNEQFLEHNIEGEG